MMRAETMSWRKVENEKGFVFYVNEAVGSKQWDHPKFGGIKLRLDECNYVKYSNYRIASKMRVLQHELFMEDVPLSIIVGVFQKHRLGATESSLCLETCDLEAILTDIYFAANKQNHTNIDIDFATELMLTLLYNIFDKERQGKIQVLPTKLLLSILSNCQISELYHFFFTLCSDHNNCVTRHKLQTLLSKIAEITTFMHEDAHCGRHLVNPSIEDCFVNSPGLVGIDETAFLTWIESPPQFLAWVPTLFRIKSAQTVVHSARCSSCRTTPLMGLKYKCIKCTRYTQCQTCFLTGRTSSSHKLSHPMKEYCSEGGSKEFTHAFVKKLCGLLRCSVQNNFTTTTIEANPLREEKSRLIQTDNISDNIQPFSSPHAQLQTVIRQLEMQNSELQQMLLLSNKNDKEIKRYLEEHRLHVAAQIHKLKVLKDYLQVAKPAVVQQNGANANHLQSTPMILNGKQSRLGLDIFSPITPIVEQGQVLFDSGKGEASNNSTNGTMSAYSLKDVSSWVGGKPSIVNTTQNQTAPLRKSPALAMHSDLDEALAKLQQILANNFSLDESLGTVDNGQLKSAVTEVEGVLSTFIDTVENSRATSTQPANFETDSLSRCRYV